MANFQISLSIQERINQAEKLPQQGNMNDMIAYKGIRSKLVGWTEAQMNTYRIIERGGTFLTGKPTDRLMVTLTEEQVLQWAELIRRRSEAGQLGMDEAEALQPLLAKADELIAEQEEQAQAQQEQGEGNEGEGGE